MTLACIERDKHARSTIAANRPNWKLSDKRDIVDAAATLSPRDLGLRRRQLGVLAGGPPCQPFSKAAQWAASGRAGIEDPRCEGLRAFFKLAERFLPTVVLIENVPGFVKGRSSALRTVNAALHRINRLNGTRYTAQWRVLNAADFGVPQSRTRAILIATRSGKVVPWPAETHSHNRVRAYDALSGVIVRPRPRMSGAWGDLISSIPEGGNYLFHTSSGDGLPLFGRRRWFWSFLLKLARDRPSWTLSAKPGPSTGPFHWANRPLAVSEILRLQSFPKSWRLMGGRDAQVRQAGNATPPLLAEIVGRAIGRHLFGLDYETSPRLKIRRKRHIPRAVPPRPVPMKYVALCGRQSDHPGEGRGPGAVARLRRQGGGTSK